MVRVDLSCFEMYRSFAFRGIGDDLLNFQVVEDTFVQLPFCRSALPELLVVVVQAGPVLSKFRQAVLVHVLNNAFCASCNPSALLQAVYLALSTALGFALHEIVIVSFASCSNKETGR